MTQVDDYLAKLTPQQRTELQRIRGIVKTTLPDVEEVMSYGMPGFKYKKKYLIGYAAFKNHMSIFPGAAPVEALKNDLKDFQLSKGTIQFTLENTIPERIIKELVRIRARAILDN